jgi:hypothetical protein
MNVQLFLFPLLFNTNPAGVGGKSNRKRSEVALNRRVQSTRPLNPESHHDPNPANGRAALTRTGWLAEAWDGKPISDAEECPITAGNGANTGLAAYLGLGGVEVCYMPRMSS